MKNPDKMKIIQGKNLLKVDELVNSVGIKTYTKPFSTYLDSIMSQIYICF